MLCRVYVLLPLWFWRQASWRVSLLGMQVGGAGVQVLETLTQPLSTGLPYGLGHVCSRFQVSVPFWLTGQDRCSVTEDAVQV